MEKIHEQKLNKSQKSRAPLPRLDAPLLSPPRARKGRGFLIPLTVNDIRRELKSQLNSCQVVVKRMPNGGWAVLRDANWGKKLKAFWERARRDGSTPQEQRKLFDGLVNEEVERVTRQTEKQVQKAVRLLRRILAPRKKSPRRPARRNFVLTRPRSRQPRRHGKTRAPTDGKESSDGDGGNGSSCQATKRARKTQQIQVKGLDEIHFVKPFNFKKRGDIHAAQIVNT